MDVLSLPLGVSLSGMRNETRNGIKFVIVNFRERGNWFSEQEEKILKDAGIFSSFGFCTKQDSTNYSVSCCGENDLFDSKQDWEDSWRDSPETR